MRDTPEITMSDLQKLEDKSVYIIREAYQSFDKVGMLWSIGKDSSVMLWLLRKAFLGHIPIPMLHVDTTYKIPEMIRFRDQLQKKWGFELIVETNEEVVASGETFPNGKATRVECCSKLKKDALASLIGKHKFDAVFAGIRRDEEGTRAKERYFSPRGQNFTWDFKDQPPELWDQYKTDFAPGTHIRVHPLLHWTESDIWAYIKREEIPVVPVYFAGEGSCPSGKRYRSLGCAPCTSRVDSTATNVDEILVELRTTNIAERSTRAQDQEAEDAFEKLREQGYM